jgi:hypothetical protein
MNEINLIRKLAKLIKNQNLFSSVKEISSLRLFYNEIDLSLLQHIYLSYLYFYNSIYSDINMKEINDTVLKDEFYEDCYIEWKKNNQGKDKINPEKKNKSLHIVFRKRKKKDE